MLSLPDDAHQNLWTRLQSHHASMMWTTDKPTTPGWYWYRPAPDQNVEVVEIARPYGDLHIYMLGDPEKGPSYEQVEGEWAGPLEPP